MTAKNYIFTKHHAQRKILKYKLCRVVDPSKKVPDLNCQVEDLLLEVRPTESQTTGAGSAIRWDPPNLTPGINVRQDRQSRNVTESAATRMHAVLESFGTYLRLF